MAYQPSGVLQNLLEKVAIPGEDTFLRVVGMMLMVASVRVLRSPFHRLIVGRGKRQPFVCLLRLEQGA